MTIKKYDEIISKYKSYEVLHIVYKTKHSTGEIACSIAFFLEFYKKLCRLLKKVNIKYIFLKNEDDNKVYKYFIDLESVLEWSINQYDKNNR